MRMDVTIWAAAALLLMAAETIIPGAFLLWMGIAAGVVFVIVLLIPGIPVLAQVAAFVVLSFITILLYRKFIRGRERKSDHPTLNRRAAQHVGKIVALEQAIIGGRGRVKIGDAFWVVQGPDLALGSRVRITGSDGVNLSVEADTPSA
ncbi:hypothetical protein AXE65_05355 [Ventosimonas gracilis]|uniref:NfeD-like C-terminal domain-containing protein n=1 Tax=Ventosimonas gracilis TaxID=1680762 RepID=A0A139SP86_9GAMM|nr:hypothetical protein AXE65_05355 [Ventosimonas gracilis]